MPSLHGPQQLHKTPVTATAPPPLSPPSNLPRPFKSPPYSNTSSRCNPATEPQPNCFSFGSNLYKKICMVSIQDLSISIYSLELGVGRGHFYCIEISRNVTIFPSYLLFSLSFSCCDISSWYINCFLKLFHYSTIPLSPLHLLYIVDTRVI